MSCADNDHDYIKMHEKKRYIEPGKQSSTVYSTLEITLVCRKCGNVKDIIIPI